MACADCGLETSSPTSRSAPLRHGSEPGSGRRGQGSGGAGRSVGRREADRRQVTGLFADLSGFASLAEPLDPEEVRAFQNALFATLAQAIERYDNFVEKFVGDAVMAVFGAPVAHEDDPLRALDAIRPRT